MSLILTFFLCYRGELFLFLFWSTVAIFTLNSETIIEIFVTFSVSFFRFCWNAKANCSYSFPLLQASGADYCCISLKFVRYLKKLKTFHVRLRVCLQLISTRTVYIRFARVLTVDFCGCSSNIKTSRSFHFRLFVS